MSEEKKEEKDKRRMCMLGDFKFIAYQTGLNTLNESLSYHFERTQTLASTDDVQAISQFNRTYELAGSLIKKSNSSLDTLEKIAQRKQPVTLSFVSGKAYKVIITAINKNRSLFLDNGIALKCDFSVSLEEV